MPIDTTTFFYVILSGFMAVWIFRYFTNKKEKLSEFEWLGLSAFWGLLIFSVVYSLSINSGSEKYLNNPLLTGLVSSLWAIFFGWCASYLSNVGLFLWLLKILGRRDK